MIWSGPADVGADGETTLGSILDGPHSSPADPALIDADICAIIYTSGSTGLPKGVMLSHRNMTNTAWSISTYLRNEPDDVVICLLPMSFDYGLYQMITGARVGFTVVLEKSFAYPYAIVKRIAELGVTGLPGVPTIFATILQLAPYEDLDLGSVRYLSNTAAALPSAHIHRLPDVFENADIYSMYGLTECTRVSYLAPEMLHEKISSVGKAMPNEEVFVVDEQGNKLPAGEIGELVIRGANVMLGYWNNPEATAARIRPGEFIGERCLYSGDLFRLDEDGFLYFVGRQDDMFKCKGEKISPTEVENVLYAMEAVAEAAIVGVTDSIDGRAIKAFVVPRPGIELTSEQVRRHCRANLENYMVPKIVEIRDTLPKTPSGKIRKAGLTD